jgi:hypothetical protein
MVGQVRRTLAALPGARAAARAARSAAAGAVRRTLDALPVAPSVRRTLAALRGRPGWYPPEAIELVDALNRALRAVPDPDGALRSLHHRWVRIFGEAMEAVAEDLRPRPGFDAVSLGAGRQNPLAFALLLHQAGARRVWIVEPELAADDLPPGAWWGLQEMALRLLVGDVRSPHLVRPTAAIGSFVDLRGLFFGDPARALRPEAACVVGAYAEDAKIPDESVGLVTSRSVLEHVTETERCFDALAAMVAPGGVMYHSIDLSAHDDGDPFAFYYTDAGAGPRRTDDLNGLRLCDYLRAFSARGFESRVVDRTQLGEYDLGRRPLLPRYRGYAEEDLRCRRAVILSRKPLSPSMMGTP